MPSSRESSETEELYFIIAGPSFPSNPGFTSQMPVGGPGRFLALGATLAFASWLHE
jgi:hypothetical protein